MTPEQLQRLRERDLDYTGSNNPNYGKRKYIQRYLLNSNDYAYFKIGDEPEDYILISEWRKSKLIGEQIDNRSY